MADYSVWVLEYGYVDRFPASNLFAAQPNLGHRRMPYCFGLLRSADRCILVDTGFWDEATHERLTTKYGLTHWRRPVDVLRDAGVAAEDVDTVVLTHSHFDHAGCVDEFPRAHVYIQRREIDQLAAAREMPDRFEFLTRSCVMGLVETLGQREAQGTASLVDGDHALAEGLHLVPMDDTHTSGSQVVVLDNDSDGSWLFAGDNVYSYENLEGIAGDGVMAPIAMSTGSAVTWLTSVDSILTRVGGDTSRVLPFHEAALWERFPSVTLEGLHLAEISLAGGHPSLLSRPRSRDGQIV